MTHTINLISTALASINGWTLAGLLGMILFRRAIGHRPFIWRVFIFMFSQGLSAAIVSSDIYRHKFGIIEAVVRMVSAVSGFACVMYMVKMAASVNITLKETEELERQRQEVANDRVMANDNLVVAFDVLARSRERYAKQLTQQLVKQTGG